MKIITLTQPWASLMRFNLKNNETRDWGTEYRGPLVIHSAMNFPDWAHELCLREPFKSALESVGLTVDTLPLGYALAIRDLVGIEKVTGRTVLPPEPERSFGDYSLGRRIWYTKPKTVLDPPIRYRGAQGIRDWMP